jgi:3-hydroxybutyryl-CoA dehydratase
MKKGDKFQRRFVVTEATYQGFISLFADRNPLHVDQTFAREKGFQSEVMHGNILNGFLSFFVGECLPLKNVIIHSQAIQFHKPVYKDDVLELHAEVSEVFESVNAFEFRFHFANQADLKVAKGRLQIGII